MTRAWAVAASAMLALFAACSLDATPLPVAATSPAHNAIDVAFARDAVARGERALTMISQVPARTGTPDLRDLAQHVDLDQETAVDRSTRMLVAWRESRPPPGAAATVATPGNDQVVALAATNGRAFDRAFLQMMIAHHIEAIAAARRELAAGADNGAAALARDLIDTEQREIDRMDVMLRAR